MLKLNGKQLTIDLDKVTRTKRQKHALNSLIKENDMLGVLGYVSSFNGKRNKMSVERPTSGGLDPLARKNYFVELLSQWCDTDRDHKPTLVKGTWFGVEIECLIPIHGFDDSREDCAYCDGTGTREDEDGNDYECGECDGTRHSGDSDSGYHRQLRRIFERQKIKYVSIKDDGSIHPDDDSMFGVEVTVLTRLEDMKNLERTCTILNDLGAKVNKTCGLHVHLDARHLTSGEVVPLADRLVASLPILSAMVPASRRNNTFCHLSRNNIGDSRRYYAVNIAAFDRHETIEIRLHSGTTNFNKIVNWVEILNAIVKAKSFPKKIRDAAHLYSYIKIKEETFEYMLQRIALFSPELNCTNIETIDLDSTESDEAVNAVTQFIASDDLRQASSNLGQAV